MRCTANVSAPKSSNRYLPRRPTPSSAWSSASDGGGTAVFIAVNESGVNLRSTLPPHPFVRRSACACSSGSSGIRGPPLGAWSATSSASMARCAAISLSMSPRIRSLPLMNALCALIAPLLTATAVSRSSVKHASGSAAAPGRSRADAAIERDVIADSPFGKPRHLVLDDEHEIGQQRPDEVARLRGAVELVDPLRAQVLRHSVVCPAMQRDRRGHEGVRRRAVRGPVPSDREPDDVLALMDTGSRGRRRARARRGRDVPRADLPRAHRASSAPAARRGATSGS